MLHDVIIIGGSYSGMAAALQLVRARRNVLVIDGGQRRNRFAHESHGFLTQDGVDPAIIATTAREQLEAYSTLFWREVTAVSTARQAETFTVETSDGGSYQGRRLLLAVGVSDELPDIPGLAERWGRHVFHCPYCHGYELDRGRVGVIATADASQHQAQLLTEWGETTFFVNGACDVSDEERKQLTDKGMIVETTPIEKIEGGADVRLTDGRLLSFAGLFTAPKNAPSTPLVEALGCELEETPFGKQIKTDGKQTSIPGVFACGDAAHAPTPSRLPWRTAPWRGRWCIGRWYSEFRRRPAHPAGLRLLFISGK